jgi:hypothetical protein
MSNRDPLEALEVVGYRRPPKEAQFKPGQSGNPKGRPKGSRSIAAIVKEVTEEKITIIENGKRRKVTRFQAALLQLSNNAMRGDTKALRQLVDLQKQFGDSPDHSSAKNNEPLVRTVLVLPSNGREKKLK